MTAPALDRIPGRVDVLGVKISCIDRPMAVETIAQWIARREQHYVCVSGVHGVMEAQGDPDLLRIHNESGLTTPDGMPLVWCAHRAGAEHVTRVYGPDLMLDVCERGAREGWRMFFYGGADGVAQSLADTMAARFPGLVAVGAYSPPFRPLSDDEIAAECEMINAARPDIVWVGLSTPKQERWMASRKGRLEAPVMVGVGAAFDFHTGRVRQAPRLVQKLGLEWFFRMCMEPKRLWKRYFNMVPRFLAKIVRNPPKLDG